MDPNATVVGPQSPTRPDLVRDENPFPLVDDPSMYNEDLAGEGLFARGAGFNILEGDLFTLVLLTSLISPWSAARLRRLIGENKAN